MRYTFSNFCQLVLLLLMLGVIGVKSFKHSTIQCRRDITFSEILQIFNIAYFFHFLQSHIRIAHLLN